MYVISSNELRKINKAIENGEREIRVSLDLGKTSVTLKIEENKLILLDGTKIGPTKIRDDDKSCYMINKSLQKMQFFSKETNLFYKLVPTSEKPILKISSTPMHKKEFVEKIQKERLKGYILDSGTGLGYTAINASRTAQKVLTIEWDQTVIEIAKLNPYSQGLFKNKNIKIIKADLTEKITAFKDNSFDNIILDGGTPSLSGNFFSLNNYEELFRVLKKNGKLYHYVPHPQIKSGRNFMWEIGKRLEKAGFKIIEDNKEGSYIIAEK